MTTAGARSVYLSGPYLVGLLILIAVPVAVTIYLAGTEYSGIESPRWTGLENLTRMFGDRSFWRSLGNSAIYVGLSVPLRIGAALAFALLLHRRSVGHGAARASAYLPSIVPDVAFALLWLWIFNPLYGPVAVGMSSLGLTSPGWLTDPWAARVGIALMGAFQIGEAFVVVLAARRTIPASLYEAADLEGASPFYALRRVTLPVLAPILILLVLRDVILSFQSNFVAALIVTEGGPARATTFLPLYIYQQGFGYFRLGYAAALSLTMFAITGVVVLVQYLLARRWRYL